jgi:hypothetical protein
MGWTFTHKDKGVPIKEFFDKEFADKDGVSPIVACAVIEKVAYLAYRSKDSLIYGLVCALQYAPKDYNFNFGYKDMSEEMGPRFNKCPAQILDLLSPVEELFGDGLGKDWATEWRQTCREALEKKTSHHLKDGETIKFERPFTSGNTFQVVKYGRKTLFKTSAGRLVRLLGWTTIPYSVVS